MKAVIVTLSVFINHQAGVELRLNCRLSQLLVLEISDTRAKHIQDNLNSFIFYNKPNKAGAKVYLHVKEEVLYGRKSEGGFGMIRVDDFFDGLKCSLLTQIRTNTQVDLIYSHFQLSKELNSEITFQNVRGKLCDIELPVDILNQNV